MSYKEMFETPAAYELDVGRSMRKYPKDRLGEALEIHPDLIEKSDFEIGRAAITELGSFVTVFADDEYISIELGGK